MTAAAFDTLSAARDLETAGIERRQAEAIAGTVRQAAAVRFIVNLIGTAVRTGYFD